jgi:hypothetical protein
MDNKEEGHKMSECLVCQGKLFFDTCYCKGQTMTSQDFDELHKSALAIEGLQYHERATIEALVLQHQQDRADLEFLSKILMRANEQVIPGEIDTHDALVNELKFLVQCQELLGSEAKETSDLRIKVAKLTSALNRIGMLTHGELAYTAEFQDKVRSIIDAALKSEGQDNE